MPAPSVHRSTFLAALIAFSLFSTGCSWDFLTGSSTITFSADAVATKTCGAADAPGLAIYVAATPVTSLDPPAPYFRISIWHALSRLTERTWTVGGNGPKDDASGWHFRNDDDFEIATSGDVTVNSVAADSTIEGSARLEFPSGDRIEGEFRAVWISQADHFCG